MSFASSLWSQFTTPTRKNPTQNKFPYPKPKPPGRNIKNINGSSGVEESGTGGGFIQTSSNPHVWRLKSNLSLSQDGKKKGASDRTPSPKTQYSEYISSLSRGDKGEMSKSFVEKGPEDAFYARSGDVSIIEERSSLSPSTSTRTQPKTKNFVPPPPLPTPYLPPKPISSSNLNSDTNPNLNPNHSASPPDYEHVSRLVSEDYLLPQFSEPSSLASLPASNFPKNNLEMSILSASKIEEGDEARDKGLSKAPWVGRDKARETQLSTRKGDMSTEAKSFLEEISEGQSGMEFNDLDYPTPRIWKLNASNPHAGTLEKDQQTPNPPPASLPLNSTERSPLEMTPTSRKMSSPNNFSFSSPEDIDAILPTPTLLPRLVPAFSYPRATKNGREEERKLGGVTSNLIPPPITSKQRIQTWVHTHPAKASAHGGQLIGMRPEDKQGKVRVSDRKVDKGGVSVMDGANSNVSSRSLQFETMQMRHTSFKTMISRLKTRLLTNVHKIDHDLRGHHLRRRPRRPEYVHVDVDDRHVSAHVHDADVDVDMDGHDPGELPSGSEYLGSRILPPLEAAESLPRPPSLPRFQTQASKSIHESHGEKGRMKEKGEGGGGVEGFGGVGGPHVEMSTVPFSPRPRSVRSTPGIPLTDPQLREAHRGDHRHAASDSSTLRPPSRSRHRQAQAVLQSQKGQPPSKSPKKFQLPPPARQYPYACPRYVPPPPQEASVAPPPSPKSSKSPPNRTRNNLLANDISGSAYTAWPKSDQEQIAPQDPRLLPKSILPGRTRVGSVEEIKLTDGSGMESSIKSATVNVRAHTWGELKARIRSLEAREAGYILENRHLESQLRERAAVLSSLRFEVSRRDAALSHTQAKLESQLAQANEMEKNVSESGPLVESLKRQAETLQARCGQARRELYQLQNRIDAEISRASPSVTTGSLPRPTPGQGRLIDRVESVLSFLNLQAKEALELCTDRGDMIRSLREAISKANETNTMVENKFVNEIRTLRHQTRMLEAELVDKNRTIEGIDKASREIQLSIERLQITSQEQKERLSTAVSRADKLNKTVGGFKAEAEKWEAMAGRLRREVESKGEAIQRLETIIQELRRQVSELEWESIHRTSNHQNSTKTLERMVHERDSLLEEKSESLKQALSHKQGVELQLTQAISRTQQAEARASELQRTVERLRESLLQQQTVTSEIEKALRRANQEHRELTAEAARNASRLLSASKALGEVQNSIRSMRGELETKASELAQAQQDIIEMQELHGRETRVFRQKVSALETSQSSLQQDNNRLSGLNIELDETNRKLSRSQLELEDNYHKLFKTKAETEEKNRQLWKSNSEMESKNHQLKKLNAEMEDRNRKLSRSNVDMEQKHHELSKSSLEMDERCRHLQKMLLAQNTTSAAEKEELIKLRANALEAMAASERRLTASNIELEKSKAALDRALRRADAAAAKMAVEKREKEREFNSTRGELERALEDERRRRLTQETAITSLREKVGALAALRRATEAQLAQYQDRASRSDRELTDLRARIQESSLATQRADSISGKLERELAVARGDLDAMRGKLEEKVSTIGSFRRKFEEMERLRLQVEDERRKRTKLEDDHQNLLQLFAQSEPPRVTVSAGAGVNVQDEATGWL